MNSKDEGKRESYSQKADDLIKKIGAEKGKNDTPLDDDDLPQTKFGKNEYINL